MDEDKDIQTGRTTRALEHAVNVAASGSMDKTPERWRYVWAAFLAIISFGGFDYQEYLEGFTVRRKWDVFYIINHSQQLSSV